MTWSVKPLSEVADLTLGKMLDQAKNRGEMLPYLANVNVRWGAFDLAKLREMRFEPHELERYAAKPGDIVMCEGGEPGRCALWRDQHHHMMLQKALHRIRAREGLDSTFLYYAFLHIGQSNGFAPLFTGATIKHLPREQLAKVVIPFPELIVQKAIASALSAYDDLIANNQRRIKLLEQAARMLYCEWFVQLRYPFDVTDLTIDGEQPGWDQATLDDMCLSLEDGDWIESKDQGGEDFRLLQVSNVGLGTFVETGNYRFISEQTFKSLRCREVVPGDLLISRMPDPVGRAWRVEAMPWRMITAVDVAIAKPDTNQILPEFLMLQLNSEEHLLRAAQQASGATRLRIGRKQLGALLLLKPPLPIQQRFVDVVEPMLINMVTLRQQCSKLARIRDMLLPKLMSGQLDVNRILLPEAANIAA